MGGTCGTLRVGGAGVAAGADDRVLLALPAGALVVEVEADLSLELDPLDADWSADLDPFVLEPSGGVDGFDDDRRR